MTRSRTIALITMTTFVLMATAYVYAQATRIPVTADDERAGTPDTQVTMHTKLTQSQRVTEGLVRRDFEMIQEAAVTLRKISLSPPPSLKKSGDSSDEAVYEHFRMEFARLTGKLEGNAVREELEATAYVHQQLTATCIACHDYIRDYN